MFSDFYLSRKRKINLFFFSPTDIMSPLREGIEDKLGSEEFFFLDGWMCQLGNEMLKVHAGLLEGPARGCQSPRAEIKVGQTRAAARQIEECHCNDCTAAAAISHCPSSR